MSSQRRILASRANGARSRGPVTPQGKERSARNAIRHGLLARSVVLQDEAGEAFQALVADFVARHCPVDNVELALVEEMAAAVWRQRRCWAIETRVMDDAAALSGLSDPLGRIAHAFTALAAGPELGLIHRYETRQNMIYQRALNNLLLLRAEPMPDEPNPNSEHGLDLPEPPDCQASTALPEDAVPDPAPEAGPPPAVPDAPRRPVATAETADPRPSEPAEPMPGVPPFCPGRAFPRY